MEKEKRQGAEFPLVWNRWEYGLAGVLFGVIGIPGVFWILLSGDTMTEKLEVGFFTLGFLLLGAAMLLRCAVRIRPEPEGVRVQLFGKTLAWYPCRKLTVFRWDIEWNFSGLNQCLCLSSRSVAELADLREQKLRRSWLNRDGVDYRKRDANWQVNFALEQIRKINRLSFLLPVRRDVLCFDMTPENLAILRELCPGAVWVDRRKKPRPEIQYEPVTPVKKTKKQDTPEDFRRNLHPRTEPAGTLMLMWISIYPAIVLEILGAALLPVYESAFVVFGLIALVWLFGSMAYLAIWRYGNDWVSLEKTGIRIRSKSGRERKISAGEIKTVWRFRIVGTKFGCVDYLALCPHSREELLRMEEAQMEKSRWGRGALAALRGLKAWPTVAVRRRLVRRLQKVGYEDSELLLIGHTDEREVWLRAKYPECEYYDLTDEMFVLGCEQAPMRGESRRSSC